MAVLTYSQIEALMLDDLGANVTTDAPVTSGAGNEAGRWINDAYSSVWEIAGARVKRVADAAAWTGSVTATGTLTGLLADVGEILHLFATTTAPAAVSSNTHTSTAVDSAALFGAVTAGMAVSGSGVPADTFVAIKTDASNLVLSRATASTLAGTSLTFSPTSGAIEVKKAKDLAEIQYLRANTASGSALGTYATPKLYAPVFVASALSTAVPGNLLVVEYWPSITGYYFPMHYAPQFLPMDATSITTPDVNDLESRDIAHIAALALCQNLGRAEFAPAIAAKISDKTQQALARKIAAMMDAKASA